MTFDRKSDSNYNNHDNVTDVFINAALLSAIVDSERVSEKRQKDARAGMGARAEEVRRRRWHVVETAESTIFLHEEG